jgi:hypothetical protein
MYIQWFAYVYLRVFFPELVGGAVDNIATYGDKPHMIPPSNISFIDLCFHIANLGQKSLQSPAYLGALALAAFPSNHAFAELLAENKQVPTVKDECLFRHSNTPALFGHTA